MKTRRRALANETFDTSNIARPAFGCMRCGAGPGGTRPGMGNRKRPGMVIKNEDGFIETYVLTVYLIVILTIFAFILGLGVGMWKEASAKYMWFAEAMDFAAQAANKTGDLEEVVLNRDLARSYFVNTMDEMVGEYRLDSFYAVGPGCPVPNGTARNPGYVATITVPVFEAKVPLIGTQQVKIPMRYFAVVKSGQIQD